MALSCEHPFVVAAVEALLDDEAVLSQYQVYCRTPGAKGTGNGSRSTRGAGVCRGGGLAGHGMVWRQRDVHARIETRRCPRLPCEALDCAAPHVR